MAERIRIALLGAGIFARDAHLPALKNLTDRFEIVAVYSRTRATAEALLADMATPPDIYTDAAEILRRDDIQAIDVLLPIDLLPSAVDMALAAGKHVVSEKPIAPDVAAGRRLIDVWRNHPGQIWMVAENWRYEPAFRQAAEIVRGGGLGAPLIAHWALHIPLTADNKYYATAWRRSGSFPGGFLIDGGVHHVAVWRQVLGEIRTVSAAVAQMRPDLPPADTLSAAMQFDSGVVGSYTASYAAAAPWAGGLRVVGERGSLVVDRGRLDWTIDGVAHETTFPPSQSVRDELAAFADTIERGAAHRNSPEEGLQDVAVIEAMLHSHETGSRIAPERLVQF
jgi:predicted dehydrogenase